MDACIWLAANTGEFRDHYRTDMVDHIVMMADRFVKNGDVARSLADVDAHTRAVLGDMNLPLVQYLMDLAGHDDEDLVDMLKGAPIYGHIPTSGRGVPRDADEPDDIEELWRNRVKQNEKMARSIRPSDHDEQVMIQTMEDVKLGRMSKPVVYSPCDGQCDGILSSRFGVEQNLDIRCIDNGTSSGVNPCAGASERIREHRLDTMYGLAQYLWLLGITMLAVCKSDVSAAFRRIPVM